MAIYFSQRSSEQEEGHVLLCGGGGGSGVPYVFFLFDGVVLATVFERFYTPSVCVVDAPNLPPLPSSLPPFLPFHPLLLRRKKNMFSPARRSVD